MLQADLTLSLQLWCNSGSQNVDSKPAASLGTCCNADSQVPLQSHWIRNSRGQGPAIWVLISPLGGSDGKVWEPLLHTVLSYTFIYSLLHSQIYRLFPFFFFSITSNAWMNTLRHTFSLEAELPGVRNRCRRMRKWSFCCLCVGWSPKTTDLLMSDTTVKDSDELTKAPRKERISSPCLSRIDSADGNSW